MLEKTNRGNTVKDNIESIQILKDLGFKIGDKLLHTSFGVGILVDIDDDRIMIEFKDSTKVLSADLCLDSKIIIKMK